MVLVKDSTYQFDLAEEAMMMTIKANEKGRGCWKELAAQATAFRWDKRNRVRGGGRV